ncbi:hypothetical protein V8G54_014791 [Vigna mungo]|uniref:Uncharacterized protein n=1 Tax=Vigna mungo TaxID=3915 RepID=A0AAQ3RZJ8_VIGMU
MFFIAPHDATKFRSNRIINTPIRHKGHRIRLSIPHFCKRNPVRIHRYFHRGWRANRHVIHRCGLPHVGQRASVPYNLIGSENDRERWIIEVTRVSKFGGTIDVGMLNHESEMVEGIVEGAQKGNVVLCGGIINKARR